MSELIDKYFKISERSSTIGTEIRAGTASFFTLSYLLLVNPQIMSKAGVSEKDAVIATCLSSAISCFIVGFGGNLPFGTAPGIGLSAYLSFSLVQTDLCTLEEALTTVFVSGIVLLIVAITGFTSFLMKIVPECVKYGIVVGMGLLIAMIGMVSVNLIIPNVDTIVGLGPVTEDLVLQLTLLGVILVGTLIYHDIKGGILIGIGIIAILQWTITSTWPNQIFELPSIVNNNYIHLDVMIDPKQAVVLWTAVGAFLLICVFDISGVMFGLATLSGLIEENTGNIPGNLWVFFASAAGTVIAAFFGSTPIICCVETASGIKEGGRTGLTSVVIGIYFLASLFLSPLFAAVPNDATAPVLILVGVMMMNESSKVEWNDMSQAVPAFLTLALMPLTYSITNGTYILAYTCRTVYVRILLYIYIYIYIVP
jgi:AGZA family xanthine/uracil permease-like MFS transporter